MKEQEIPAFVQSIIAIGCDICAVGHDFYHIGDADLSTREYNAIKQELKRTLDTYGDRDHLRLAIVAHLRSLGRYLDIGSEAKHWSENTNSTH